jgi:hypothetical protein
MEVHILTPVEGRTREQEMQLNERRSTFLIDLK